MEDTDRVLCDCGSLISLKSRYCGFCGNRVEISHTNYIRSETYQEIVKRKPPIMNDVDIDQSMTSPSWIKSKTSKRINIQEIDQHGKFSLMKAGSPVPVFLMMTSVMIWIGGVIFFFVEITF